MVKCNSCHTLGLHFVDNILHKPDGTIHRCLKGKGVFMWHGMKWEYIEDGCEPDPNIHRQVRMEGNTWTLYVHGIQYHNIQRNKK